MAHPETPNPGGNPSEDPQPSGRSGGLARGNLKAEETLNGRAGGGDSGGGAYSNPHTGKDGDEDGFMGHGGQTGMAYHGTGQLGGRSVGENANSPTEGTKADDDEDHRSRP